MQKYLSSTKLNFLGKQKKLGMYAIRKYIIFEFSSLNSGFPSPGWRVVKMERKIRLLSVGPWNRALTNRQINLRLQKLDVRDGQRNYFVGEYFERARGTGNRQPLRQNGVHFTTKGSENSFSKLNK